MNRSIIKLNGKSVLLNSIRFKGIKHPLEKVRERERDK